MSDRPQSPSPERETFHLLRAVTVEFGLRQAAFAGEHGLHPTDVRALICLLDAERAGEDATPGRLGAELGLNSAGTTSVLDRLERLGHLTRERDPRDRRRVLLRVTGRAKELGWAYFGPLVHGTEELLRGFAPAERAAVDRFLHGVRELMTGEGAPVNGSDSGGS
ncbi:MarR family winged helix-turn-helix transcriptional regulator [Streptomyces tritici]|uniref:MarR family winged helix-turn-helix transcriptional regulator n=1 Tax=Streptomyces tritici TaxID=2054410 RepID=UPI003AF0369C